MTEFGWRRFKDLGSERLMTMSVRSATNISDGGCAGGVL
jgi:hypothetical protein